MLAPNERQHLLQALRPPQGYELDFAIGTTYSLDLMALLSVPLAFAQFDWEDDAGRPAADPLALLEALRRYAGRMHIFCQAGCISAAPKNQYLFGYLEQSIVQVKAPLGGVFHPKVWILRFVSANEPVIYRLLCLSRNLTFDSSWDTLLLLEGEVIDRQRAFSLQRPLADFINALPSLAYETVPEHILANINTAQEELRRVQFDAPDGFELYSFWPIGIPGYQNEWPFEGNYDRFLVVSPFLTSEFLQRLASQGSDHVLMSRLDSLSALHRRDLAGYKKVFALNPMAEMEEPDPSVSESQFLETTHSGLHAKLYVGDIGRRASLWTGSANATSAAFRQNVEFLVQLVGAKSVCGVDAFVEGAQEQSKFADLWQPFNPLAKADKVDAVQKKLELSLWSAQTNIVSMHWHGRVIETSKKDEILLRVLHDTNVQLASNVQANYWPLSLSPSIAATYVELSPYSDFGPLAVESLTAFMVFQLTARVGDRSMASQFILQIPLENVPEDRQERLLRAMLKNREQVMRFLLFILSDGSENLENSGIALLDVLTSENPETMYHYRSDIPLFESLVQALYRDPTRLDHIARTVADLERTPDGMELLPEGFHAIWAPIWEARQRMRL